MKQFGCCFAFALATGALACSSHDATSGGSVDGTFAGGTVNVAGTSAFSGSAGNVAYLGEVLASQPDVCSLLQQHVTRANVSGLSLLIQSSGVDAAPPAVAPGTYAVTHGTPAKDTTGNVLDVSASYNALDANCQPTYAETASQASAGTISIDAVAPNVSGSFDLTFPNGDHLTGTFSSPLCATAAPAPQAPATADTVCRQ